MLEPSILASVIYRESVIVIIQVRLTSFAYHAHASVIHRKRYQTI